MQVFFDESGTIGDTTEFYAVVACLVRDEDKSLVCETLSRLRHKNVQRFNLPTFFFHNTEINSGLNGEGPLKMLAQDKVLKQEFITDIKEILSLPYALYASGFNWELYERVLNAALARHYQARGESWQLRDIEKIVPFNLPIVDLVEMIKKKEVGNSYSTSEFYFEEGMRELARIEHLITVFARFFNNPSFNFSLPKMSQEYGNGMEIADLCASAVRRFFATGKKDVEFIAFEKNLKFCKPWDEERLLGMTKGL